MEGLLGTKDIEGPDVSEHCVKSSGSTGGHELLGPDPQSITVPNEVISLLHRADALLAARRETWGLVIYSATLKYLLKIYTPSDLHRINHLLKTVRNNLPVANLIGWAYYFGTHNWAEWR